MSSNTKEDHVRKRREILRRLARPRRPPHPQILHQPPRRTPTRSRNEGTRAPKTEGAGPTLASILRAAFFGPQVNCADRHTAQALIAAAGDAPPTKLRSSHVAELDDQIFRSKWAHATRVTRSNALKKMLRWLWENHGAPKLDAHVRKYPGLRPRNVTVTEEERALLLNAAPPHMRLWLLLCSDLAMRSGTAIRIAPEHYDRLTGQLTFTTKYGARLRLPVTRAVEELFNTCTLADPSPFVLQLWRTANTKRGHPPVTVGDVQGLRDGLIRLRLSLGITRRIVPHDLRRTTAVAMLRHTKDVRDVQALLGHRSLQATIWYLDHDLRPIAPETLEAIKRPFLVQRKEQSA